MNYATVQIAGGLGNQLYSYAFGRALTEHKKIKVYYDCESAFWADPYKREFILDDFKNIKIKTIFVPKTSLGRLLFKTKNKIKKYISNYCRISSKLFLLEAEPYKFRNRLIQTDYKRNIYFSGYWQSYKYFESIQGLRDELSPPEPRLDYSKKALDEIRNSNSCAVHWRFYTEHKEYNKQLLNYYLASIAQIQEKNPDTKFFIFSDDHTQAKRMLKQVNIESIFVDNKEAQGNRQSLEDFYLMYACKNIIIGNSSFSWWAAWLSDHGKKLVYFPYNLSPYGDDWTPKHWQRVDFD